MIKYKMCDEDSILSVFTHLKKIHVARLLKWLILYCIVHYIVSRGRIWTQPQCPWSVRAALLVRPSCQMYAFHSFIQRASAWLYILHTAPHHQKCPRTCSSVGMRISHWCDCDVGKMRRSRGQGAQAEGCFLWKFNLTHLT